MADLIAGPFVLAAYVLLAVIVGAALMMPIAIWSASRNIKQIRMQLERLNDSLDARASETRTGAAVR